MGNGKGALKYIDDLNVEKEYPRAGEKRQVQNQLREKKDIRENLRLRYKTLLKKRNGEQNWRPLSVFETSWILGLTGPAIEGHVKAGRVKALVIGGSGLPHQIDAEHVGELLKDPPSWLIRSWGQSTKVKNTNSVPDEELAKRAYMIFKEDGKLPYPLAFQTSGNRSKYYSQQEMADKLGITFGKYDRIKPLVDIMFEIEKKLKNELVIWAVQRQFDRTIAKKEVKAIPELDEKIMDVEYQINE